MFYIFAENSEPCMYCICTQYSFISTSTLNLIRKIDYDGLISVYSFIYTVLILCMVIAHTKKLHRPIFDTFLTIYGISISSN